MTPKNRWPRLRTGCVFAVVLAWVTAWALSAAPVRAAEASPSALRASFEQRIEPFLKKNCYLCHNTDTAISGVRLDQLDGSFEERRLRLWEVIRRQIGDKVMPPEGAPQPDGPERQAALDWITEALDAARSRPTPKNGNARRLTVPQYRNTLRELLLLDDDVTDTLPPDAVSEDGFVNSAETLDFSPLQMEAYLEIAADALSRSIVDPDSKPSIQNFRVDLGRSINPDPLPGKLILGANSHLLNIEDYVVTQLTPSKPLAFEPFRMRTRYRFIEGYQGNDTVRGWRDFDSIYHAVFAGMRGSRGYPKGSPYSTVPEGLLLRPAIPTDEIFQSEGTYGPKANFKISVRELPDYGRFRVTVTAARYDDGLLLDPGEPARDPGSPAAIVIRDPGRPQTVTIDKGGLFQVDLYEAERPSPPRPAAPSRLTEGLAGPWPGEGGGPGRLEGDARYVDSPFGKAVSLDGEGDSAVIPRSDAMDVGEGDFTVAAWLHPRQLRRAGIVALGARQWTHGWYLETIGGQGAFRIETTRPDKVSNGGVTSPKGMIRKDAWQHVAAVVKRGEEQTRLYVNGYLVASGTVGPENLDNPGMDLHLGQLPGGNHFHGELDEVRLYRRALDDAELQALVEPGREFAEPPPEEPQEVTLKLGEREYSAKLEQPAFLAVRLDAGPLNVETSHTGVKGVSRIVLTPLSDDLELSRRFAAFENHFPQLGVHLGLRRDCGSTFAPVGAPQTVHSGELARYVFEGAILDYPSPDVEKDNVNYLAGIREIAVRSEYTDGRDMPRLLVRSVEFEGPLYENWPPRPHRNIFIDSDRKADSAGYAREILSAFATKAYRRPVTASEKATLMAVFRQSLDAGRGFRGSIADSLQVVLTSPQFLFLVERSATPEPEPIEDLELASKLAYFLWNGPPDRTTLELADGGKLRRRLDGEVDRMIRDARFSRFVREFVSQWLSLDKFDVLEPDSEMFPKLTRDTRAQLRKEPAEFIEYLFRNNLPVSHLVDSDIVMANEVVAGYYGLGDQTDSGFEFAPIRHRRPELGGVLTQAAIMAGLSDGRESNPVKRGAWLARKIIAEPPDPPPPNIPDLAEDTEGLPLRERLARHRDQPGCAQCHAKIDPWGVPFEELDAGGRLKASSVDARSTLPDGTEVTGVNDLKRYLSQDRIDQVAFSVLKHLATYANGRSLSYNELNYLKQDGAKLRPDGYRMQDMIRYVVSNKLFLEK